MRNPNVDATRRFVTWIGILGAATALVGADPRQSPAQVGSSFGTPASQQINSPVVSPYLNLTQPGLNPGITYQTLVQPAIQVGNALANQQQMIGNLANQQQMTGNSQRSGGQPPPQTETRTSSAQTGHATSFLDTADYFPGFRKRSQRR